MWGGGVMYEGSVEGELKKGGGHIYSQDRLLPKEKRQIRAPGRYISGVQSLAGREASSIKSFMWCVGLGKCCV